MVEGKRLRAFVVGSGTMDRVVWAICARGADGCRIRRFAGVPTNAANARTEIGRRLFAMNVEAVLRQHVDAPGGRGGPPRTREAASLAAAYTYRGPAEPPSPGELVACFKAMQCLGQQCDEGDLGETGLHKELAAATRAVACAIVEAMPEYEAAPWG